MWYNCKHKPWRLNTCCDMTRVVMMCCTLWLKLWWCDTRYDTSYDDAIYAVTQTVMRCYSRWRDRQTWVVMMCYAVTVTCVTDFVSQIVTHKMMWFMMYHAVLRWNTYGVAMVMATTLWHYKWLLDYHYFQKLLRIRWSILPKTILFYPTFRNFLIDDRHYFPQLTE